MRYDSTNAGAFFPLWKKYKPVILQLMKRSMDGDAQNYQLSRHEFDDLKPVQNMVLPFKVVVKTGGKSKMDKKSLPAEDLVAILKTSNTALEMLESSEFTFTLNRECVFHVSAERTTPPEEESIESPTPPQPD